VDANEFNQQHWRGDDDTAPAVDVKEDDEKEATRAEAEAMAEATGFETECQSCACPEHSSTDKDDSECA
jgi:hypothetical protein